MTKSLITTLLLGVVTSLVATYLWEQSRAKKQSARSPSDGKNHAAYYDAMHEFISSSPYVDTYNFKNESGMLN